MSGKEVFRYLLLVVTGLFVAILIYPFLHELGHVLAAMLTGASVQQFTVFPVPSVLCDVSALRDTDIIAIGFGGMLFPIVVAIVMPRRYFILLYVRCLMLGISFLAFAISIVSIAFGINSQDDMVQMLNFWEYGKSLLISILVLLCLSIIFLIAKEKPGKRICKYFEI